jgi:hypothetical protein
MFRTHQNLQKEGSSHDEQSDRRQLGIPQMNTRSESSNPWEICSINPYDKAVYCDMPTSADAEKQHMKDYSDYEERCAMYEKEQALRKLSGNVDSFGMDFPYDLPIKSDFMVPDLPNMNKSSLLEGVVIDLSNSGWAALNDMSQQMVGLKSERHSLEIETEKLRRGLSIQGEYYSGTIIAFQNENENLKHALSSCLIEHKREISNISRENRILKHIAIRRQKTELAAGVNFNLSMWHSFVAIMLNKSTLECQRRLCAILYSWSFFASGIMRFNGLRMNAYKLVDVTLRAIKIRKGLKLKHIHTVWLDTASRVTARWSEFTSHANLINLRRHLFRLLWHSRHESWLAMVVKVLFKRRNIVRAICTMRVRSAWGSIGRRVLVNEKFSKKVVFIKISMAWSKMATLIPKQQQKVLMVLLNDALSNKIVFRRFAVEWSRIVKALVKQQRGIIMKLVAYNHADHVMMAMTGWTNVLNRKAIKGLIFRKADMLLRWDDVCSRSLRVSRYSTLFRDEYEYDVIRNVRTFHCLFPHQSEKTEENLEIFRQFHGRWPLQWKLFRSLSLNLYASANSFQRVSIKKMHEAVFLVTQTYLISKRHESSTIVHEKKYLDIVQKMFELKFMGMVNIDLQTLSLKIRAPRVRAGAGSTLSANMYTIEKIVGFYYAQADALLQILVAHCPLEMADASRLTSSKFKRTDLLEYFKSVLLSDLSTKYINRFTVTWNAGTSYGVVVKCRIVRRIDGMVSDEGKQHKCTIFEAVEQSYRGFYDSLLLNVLDIERRLNTDHKFGNLLECWDPV